MTGSPFRSAWQDHRLLLLVSALYICVLLAQVAYAGIPLGYVFATFNYFVVPLLVALVFMTGVYLVCFLRLFMAEKEAPTLRERHRRASAALDRMTGVYFQSGLFAYGCLSFITTLGVKFFILQKSLIPTLNPYGYDPYFAEWDRVLHFGHYPHEFLIPLMGAPIVSQIIDFNYAIWLVVITYVIAYNMFLDIFTHRRLRFLWTWFLSWIVLGSFFAVMMSSVGPAFFRHFYPDMADPYTGLVAHLDQMSRQYDMISAKTRNLLMDWTGSTDVFTINKLSAMPSMHVAIAWLIVLYAAQMRRWVFYAAALFFLSILTGSVYLGFHYAVDGYFSMVVVTFIWWGVGRLLDRKYPDGKKHRLWPEKT